MLSVISLQYLHLHFSIYKAFQQAFAVTYPLSHGIYMLLTFIWSILVFNHDFACSAKLFFFKTNKQTWQIKSRCKSPARLLKEFAKTKTPVLSQV